MNVMNRFPFVVLFQGIVEPQQACHELHIERISGILSSPIEADWQFEANFHRLAITFIPRSVPALSEIDVVLEQFREVGFELTTTILRSQALYSGQVLSLYSCSVSYKLGGTLNPLWVELGEARESKIPIITSKDIERATKHIAPVAIYSGHRSLQFALGDFERSIGVDGKDKLVFLY